MFAGKSYDGSTIFYALTEEWSFPEITATILQEGQMWFNSSSSALKGYGTAAGIPSATWASGGSMNTGRGSSAPSQAGSQTAAMVSTGASPPLLANVEQYNGSTWTETTDVNTARSGLGGSGTTLSLIHI